MDTNDKRRAEDAERLPAEKLVWPRVVTPTGPTTGWCGTCGSGNDAAGFAHLPLCPAAPAVDADSIALSTATKILGHFVEPIPGVQLKAKIQEAVHSAMTSYRPAAPASPKFDSDADLIAWLDRLYFCDESGAIHNTKWPAAQRAISAIRAPAVDAAKLDDLGKLKAPAPWQERMHLNGATWGDEGAAMVAEIADLRRLVAQQAARIEELERQLKAPEQKPLTVKHKANIERAASAIESYGNSQLADSLRGILTHISEGK